MSISESILPRHYAYIDSLRGYAVLGVIAVHTAQSVPGLQGTLQEVAAAGRFGVQLFFIVSALTLMLSWHARQNDLLSFYIRRFFRIAPMFWLAIVFYSMYYGFRFTDLVTDRYSLNNILLTALFLHGWHPETINGVVPGGWSIAVEATFYIIFPVLASASAAWRRPQLVLLSFFVLAILVNSIATKAVDVMELDKPEPLMSMFKSFWFFSQMPVFIIGISVYFALRSGRPSRFILNILFILALVMMAVSASVKIFPGNIQYALCLGVLTFCLGSGAGAFIVNRLASQLGKISFSCYLCHFAVIEFLGDAYGAIAGRISLAGLAPSNSCLFMSKFLLVTLVTAGLASVTYRMIERPMMAFGNRLALSSARSEEVTA